MFIDEDMTGIQMYIDSENLFLAKDNKIIEINTKSLFKQEDES